MAQYVFLFRRGEAPASSPAEMQQQMRRWMAWMTELKTQGHLKEAGQQLERAGRVVRASRKKTATDGPYAEKDLVVGYLIIEAGNLDQAEQLSWGCPIFQTNGVVEIRPVMPASP